MGCGGLAVGGRAGGLPSRALGLSGVSAWHQAEGQAWSRGQTVPRQLQPVHSEGPREGSEGPTGMNWDIPSHQQPQGRAQSFSQLPGHAGRGGWGGGDSLGWSPRKLLSLTEAQARARVQASAKGPLQHSEEREHWGVEREEVGGLVCALARVVPRALPSSLL